jgi:lysozyme
MPANIYEQLTRDEGVQRVLYRDQLGNPTVGVGHLLTTPLSDRAIQAILEDDVHTAYETLTTRLPWVTTLSDARKGAFINLTFNLGIDGLLGFSRMLRAAQAGSWDVAAAELLHSTYAKQVGDRAQRLATQLREDRWV